MKHEWDYDHARFPGDTVGEKSTPAIHLVCRACGAEAWVYDRSSVSVRGCPGKELCP